MAVAQEYETLEEAQQLGPMLSETFRHGVAQRIMNNECGLCHSTSLLVEVVPTIFRTLKEAQPFLREQERRQLEMMQAIKASRN